MIVEGVKEVDKMKTLKKSVKTIGQVFGLLIGDKFTTPAEETLKENPNLSSFIIYNPRPF